MSAPGFAGRGNAPGRRAGRWRGCVLAATVAASAIAPAAVAAQPTHRALLVGVSRYPKLPARYQLEAAPNDVARLRELLLEGGLAPFDAAHIRSLAGWPGNPADRPTRANIERELTRLAADAQRGDQVLVLLAGHGSQQPSGGVSADEPDGLDEIFLPADAAGMNGAGSFTNAITDNELAAWLGAIRAKGAVVVVIFDASHRGGDPVGEERSRGLAASEMLDGSAYFPMAARADVGGPGRLGLPPDDAGLIVLYASDGPGFAWERRRPEAGDKWHGVFTWALMEVLAQTVEPLTYMQLIERVAARYPRELRTGGQPVVGGGAGELVLGRRTPIVRPPLTLAPSWAGEGALLSAGALHGVTRDAIVAVYPPSGAQSAATLIGYARVVGTEPLRARLEPTGFDGRDAPSPELLVAGARCRIVRPGASER